MKSGKCPKCSHTKIITALPGEYTNNYECTMTVTSEPRWLFKNHRDPRHGHGVLVLHVCQKCGFAEWWVKDPENIPIGEDYKTILHDTPSDQEADIDQ
ncbi:MAG: hypothetical protein QGG42_10390 [Phycisphaerae bacterium]|jgi:hypothetical protein|nr:hypothetical protein [Phycisphaerae bacterium]